MSLYRESGEIRFGEGGKCSSSSTKDQMYICVQIYKCIVKHFSPIFAFQTTDCSLASHDITFPLFLVFLLSLQTFIMILSSITKALSNSRPCQLFSVPSKTINCSMKTPFFWRTGEKEEFLSLSVPGK